MIVTLASAANKTVVTCDTCGKSLDSNDNDADKFKKWTVTDPDWEVSNHPMSVYTRPSHSFPSGYRWFRGKPSHQTKWELHTCDECSPYDPTNPEELESWGSHGTKYSEWDHVKLTSRQWYRESSVQGICSNCTSPIDELNGPLCRHCIDTQSEIENFNNTRINPNHPEARPWGRPSDYAGNH